MKDAADRGTDSVIITPPSSHMRNRVKGRPSSRSKPGSRIPNRINLKPMRMRKTLPVVRAVARRASRGKERVQTEMEVSPM